MFFVASTKTCLSPCVTSSLAMRFLRHGVSSFFSHTLESRFVLVGLSLTKTDPLAKSCRNVQVALRSFLPPAHRRLANTSRCHSKICVFTLATSYKCISEVLKQISSSLYKSITCFIVLNFLLSVPLRVVVAGSNVRSRAADQMPRVMQQTNQRLLQSANLAHALDGK